MRVYTDGASSPDRCGGWAWVVEGYPTINRFGSAVDTTNNRMEMQAVLDALQEFPTIRDLIIVSDSQYVINCFNQKWYVNWIRNGWRTSAKKPVLNQDLWEAMIRALEARQRNGGTTKFEWVRGHDNNRWNDLADKLAVEQKHALQARIKENA